MTLAIVKGIWDFLRGVPWQVWAGIVVLLVVGLAYCQGVDAGEQKIMRQLEVAEREAKERAENAEAVATEEAQERAEGFRAQQETLKEVMENAEATGTNPLDALLGSLSGAGETEPAPAAR